MESRSLGDEGPRYLALADRIAEDVSHRQAQGWRRLPPQRDLAAEIGLDFTTVTRAYSEAKRRGLIFGHVGRGTFVKARAGAEPTRATWTGRGSQPEPSAAAGARRRRASARGVARSVFASAATSVCCSIISRAAALESHREAGASLDSRTRREGLGRGTSRRVHGCAARRSRWCSAHSRGQAISCSRKQLTYSGFRALADQLRVDVEGLAMDDDGIVPAAFERACRLRAAARAVLHADPAQSDGDRHECRTATRAIAEIAERYDVPIIEDDVYGALVSDAPAPIASIAPSTTYFVTSISKSSLGVARSDYVLAPDRAARDTSRSRRACERRGWRRRSWPSSRPRGSTTAPCIAFSRQSRRGASQAECRARRARWLRVARALGSVPRMARAAVRMEQRGVRDGVPARGCDGDSG